VFWSFCVLVVQVVDEGEQIGNLVYWLFGSALSRFLQIGDERTNFAAGGFGLGLQLIKISFGD